MPYAKVAPAVLIPPASRPMRTILFCAVKVAALKYIPNKNDNALLEETARLCTKFRAIMFVPLVGPAK